MQFSTKTVAAFAALLPSLASAHVAFIKPESVFTLHDGFDLFPIGTPDQYPCFVREGSDSSKIPTYEPGSTQSIGLQGSAIHGGGSCQISITYDNPPRADSVFKVIKSFEGSCPGGSTTGNLTPNPENILPELPFTVPSDIPSGNAVVAWSWFNKIGNREMYMRCAPVRIAGSNTDKTAFNKLPDIFKANIGNDCTTIEGTNLRFPNPGNDLVGSGDGDAVGAGCATASSPPSDPEPEPEIIPEPEPEQPEQEEPEQEEPEPETPAPSDKPSPPVLVVVPTPTPQPPKNDKPDTPPTNGTCTDGQIICTGRDSWSVCVHGKPTPMGSTAAGMNCVNGKMELVKRNVRFSHEHGRLRRHHMTV
jgi:hypothetical protein